MRKKCCPKCDHRFRRAVYDKNEKLLKGVCGFCGYVYDSSIRDASFHTLNFVKGGLNAD